MLPFTREQFVAVFADYNRAVWPAQWVAYLLAAAMLLALWRTPAARGRIVGFGLASMWAWTGIAYHGVFFARINPAATGFALLFVVQALLFAHAALRRTGLDFEAHGAWQARLGWGLVAYAVVLYPLIGLVSGHGGPGLPMFGITPCPVTLFTFGLLLLARPPVPRRLLVIPLLWALVGGSAAWLLAVPQDWLLLLAGPAVVPLLWHRAGAGARATPA